MYQKKVKILIVDDVPEEADILKSRLLPARPEDDLYIEEILALIDELLSVDIRHSVPEGLEYIHVRSPNMAIVDIIFDQATKHMTLADEREEGLFLIEKIKQKTCDSIPVFCASNAPDWTRTITDRLDMGDAVVAKNALHHLTDKVGKELREFAKRELASIEPANQSRLVKILDRENWETLTAKTLHNHYYLRDLMAGWATLIYDKNTAQPAIGFPEDIIDIIKSLLSYANGEKTKTPDS